MTASFFAICYVLYSNEIADRLDRLETKLSWAVRDAMQAMNMRHMEWLGMRMEQVVEKVRELGHIVDELYELLSEEEEKGGKT